MYVLMPEARSATAAAAARALHRAGHSVVTCEVDEDRRCAGLVGGRCPLERGPVDMALVVRPTATPERLPEEDGVLCAARRRIPLVVAGATARHPYADLAAAEDDSDDVVTTIEAVHHLPLPDHTVAASVALNACLANHDLPDTRASARVYRRGGRLQARLRFRGRRPSQATVQAAAVRVAGAVRAIDPWADGIDVSAAG